MSSSHFTDITCPWRWDGVKMLDLEIFAIFWLCCRRGHPCFTNTCLVSARFFSQIWSAYIYLPKLSLSFYRNISYNASIWPLTYRTDDVSVQIKVCRFFVDIHVTHLMAYAIAIFRLAHICAKNVAHWYIQVIWITTWASSCNKDPSYTCSCDLIEKWLYILVVKIDLCLNENVFLFYKFLTLCKHIGAV